MERAVFQAEVRYRWRHAPQIAERIIRLNPRYGEGERVRGWHPAPTAKRAIHLDVVSRVVFEKRWGKGSANRLCPNAFVKVGGKRRWISGMVYVEGPTIPN